jgi:hypothetical protein
LFETRSSSSSSAAVERVVGVATAHRDLRMQDPRFEGVGVRRAEAADRVPKDLRIVHEGCDAYDGAMAKQTGVTIYHNPN